MRTLQRRLTTDTRYTLFGLPLSVASFATTVIGFSAGLGSAVAFVGAGAERDRRQCQAPGRPRTRRAP
ncbi:hypothetical protein [Nonomuraea jiangxiensis]|uniref:hypothetical protein n=1 Tax=Nonomuraea jiangxiensis TaxID=633440 RepID=UPI000B8A198F|nr:hypothetical protein [Nonomuraea jiangxiensis]